MIRFTILIKTALILMFLGNVAQNMNINAKGMKNIYNINSTSTDERHIHDTIQIGTHNTELIRVIEKRNDIKNIESFNNSNRNESQISRLFETVEVTQSYIDSSKWNRNKKLNTSHDRKELEKTIAAQVNSGCNIVSPRKTKDCNSINNIKILDNADTENRKTDKKNYEFDQTTTATENNDNLRNKSVDKIKNSGRINNKFPNITFDKNMDQYITDTKKIGYSVPCHIGKLTFANDFNISDENNKTRAQESLTNVNDIIAGRKIAKFKEKDSSSNERETKAQNQSLKNNKRNSDSTVTSVSTINNLMTILRKSNEKIDLFNQMKRVPAVKNYDSVRNCDIKETMKNERKVEVYETISILNEMSNVLKENISLSNNKTSLSTLLDMNSTLISGKINNIENCLEKNSEDEKYNLYLTGIQLSSTSQYVGVNSTNNIRNENISKSIHTYENNYSKYISKTHEPIQGSQTSVNLLKTSFTKQITEQKYNALKEIQSKTTAQNDVIPVDDNKINENIFTKKYTTRSTYKPVQSSEINTKHIPQILQSESQIVKDVSNQIYEQEGNISKIKNNQNQTNPFMRSKIFQSLHRFLMKVFRNSSKSRKKKTTLPQRFHYNQIEISKTKFDSRKTTKYSRRFLRLLHRRRPDLWYGYTKTKDVMFLTTKLNKYTLPPAHDIYYINSKWSTFTATLTWYQKLRYKLEAYMVRDQEHLLIPHQELIYFLTDLYHIVRRTDPSFPPYAFTFADNTGTIYVLRHKAKTMYIPKRDKKRKKTTTEPSTTLSKWRQVGNLIYNYFWTTQKMVITTEETLWPSIFTVVDMDSYLPTFNPIGRERETKRRRKPILTEPPPFENYREYIEMEKKL